MKAWVIIPKGWKRLSHGENVTIKEDMWFNGLDCWYPVDTRQFLLWKKLVPNDVIVIKKQVA